MLSLRKSPHVTVASASTISMDSSSSRSSSNPNQYSFKDTIQQLNKQIKAYLLSVSGQNTPYVRPSPLPTLSYLLVQATEFANGLSAHLSEIETSQYLSLLDEMKWFHSALQKLIQPIEEIVENDIINELEARHFALHGIYADNDNSILPERIWQHLIYDPDIQEGCLAKITEAASLMRVKDRLDALRKKIWLSQLACQSTSPTSLLVAIDSLFMLHRKANRKANSLSDQIESIPLPINRQIIPTSNERDERLIDPPKDVTLELIARAIYYKIIAMRLAHPGKEKRCQLKKEANRLFAAYQKIKDNSRPPVEFRMKLENINQKTFTDILGAYNYQDQRNTLCHMKLTWLRDNKKDIFISFQEFVSMLTALLNSSLISKVLKKTDKAPYINTIFKELLNCEKTGPDAEETVWTRLLLLIPNLPPDDQKKLLGQLPAMIQQLPARQQVSVITIILPTLTHIPKITAALQQQLTNKEASLKKAATSIQSIWRQHDSQKRAKPSADKRWRCNCFK